MLMLAFKECFLKILTDLRHSVEKVYMTIFENPHIWFVFIEERLEWHPKIFATIVFQSE